MIKNVILVALGGAIGSVLRYLLTFIQFTGFSKIYLNTLITNVIGCFLIGFLSTYFLIRFNYQSLNLLFLTGFCGGFTTFSTFALENQKMMQTNQSIDSMIYIILSVILGIVFVFIGQKLANQLI